MQCHPVVQQATCVSSHVTPPHAPISFPCAPKHAHPFMGHAVAEAHAPAATGCCCPMGSGAGAATASCCCCCCHRRRVADVKEGDTGTPRWGSSGSGGWEGEPRGAEADSGEETSDVAAAARFRAAACADERLPPVSDFRCDLADCFS